MSDLDFQLQGIRDSRLAVHATSTMPAWLWDIDGKSILWANPAGAKIFGARHSRELAARGVGPADQHRRQVSKLTARLSSSGAMRMERLRGFGATLGSLATCACSRLTFEGRDDAILIVAIEYGGRFIPLTQRFAMLVDSLVDPAAAFSPNGAFVTANEAAKSVPDFSSIMARADIAGASDRQQIQTDAGVMAVDAVGTGADAGLVGVIRDIVLSPQPSSIIDQELAAASAVVAGPAAAADISEMTPAVETTPVPEHEPAAGSDKISDAENAAAITLTDTRPPAAQQHPLRFLWRMDQDGRFSLGSDEFQRLIGTHSAASIGRLWSDLAAGLGLDPQGRVAAAIATKATWTGIEVEWPVDGRGGRLPVELTGLPVYDRVRNFIGYRGFGVCRDLEGLARVAAEREDDAIYGVQPNPAVASTNSSGPANNEGATAMVDQISPQPKAEHVMDLNMNVVPFRPANDPKAPALSVKETNTFNEIARQLSARLESEPEKTAESSIAATAGDAAPPAGEKTSETDNEANFTSWLSSYDQILPRGHSAQDSQLLDRLPVGVLIYRLDRLLYANQAFLSRAGYSNLHVFADAGGLDTLYIEPGVMGGDSTSDDGASVVIAASDAGDKDQASDAKLYSIMWDGDQAMALIFAPPRAEPPASTEVMPAILPAILAAPVIVAPPAPDHGLAEELSAILDTTAEGVLMFDGLGRINSCNRSAEALFGRDGADISRSNLIDLFAPESQRAVLDYLHAVKGSGVASLLDHGREILGRARDGGTFPLSITMGRTRPEGARYFAVFRDLSQAKKRENELIKARRLAERTSMSKSDILGKISHEVRAPLNAILGFADVMIEERFGPLGNERYVEYMKDIRSSGQRVMSIIDDLLDLSQIESGNLDLALTNQDLNTMVEQCVAVMQPQANRERIIIRTSLAHALPSVKADSRALRQIALNLIGNSIHFANAGGQVIVSTAITDFGDVVLRIRDSGHGLNDNEIAAAMAPFRTPAEADEAENSGASLSLTKALVEANRAKFNIKAAPNTGTLIEVVFSHASAIA